MKHKEQDVVATPRSSTRDGCGEEIVASWSRGIVVRCNQSVHWEGAGVPSSLMHLRPGSPRRGAS